MIIGIVGSEEAKFTKLGKIRATTAILELILDPDVTEVVSGDCHLGGIDKWAEQAAHELNKKMTIFPPSSLKWADGFKPRNIKIAERSDLVVCITVDTLPDDYVGMRFKYCYHCVSNFRAVPPDHVKSGGCWTMRHAISIGKKGKLQVISNY